MVYLVKGAAIPSHPAMKPSALITVCTIVIAAGCTGNASSTHATAHSATIRTDRVGGPCEAGYCELMYLGMPGTIDPVDTSPGWFERGQKLVVSGTVYELDGLTPARDVVIYYHHTDANGLYSPGTDGPESRTRHGHLRGWMKTGKDGRFTLYTLRPAPYPDGDQPAHVHWLIKEPDVPNEYFTDDLMFLDDTLLAPFLSGHPPGNLAGSGIAEVTLANGIQWAKRDFILGLNIRDYPTH